MKNTLLLLTFLVSINVFSQEKYSPSFGIKGGANYAMVIAESDTEFDYKLGYQLGGFVDIQLKEGFFFSLGIIFAEMGTKGKADVFAPHSLYPSLLGEDVDVKISEYYILIPVVFKYKPVEKLAFVFGPQFDYFFYNKIRSKEYPSINGEQMVSKISPGVLVGLSMDISKNIIIEAHYNYGFNRTRLNSTTDDFHNVIWMLNLSYSFNKKPH
jgi:hypothetical protein